MKFQTLKGFRDILFEEAQNRRKIINITENGSKIEPFMSKIFGNESYSAYKAREEWYWAVCKEKKYEQNYALLQKDYKILINEAIV